MLNIKIEKTKTPKNKPEGALGFGKYFTDHMFMMDWDEGIGWHDARIIPYGPIPMSPASSALHYGAEIFEGMKAYHTKDGKVQLFRPYENAKRLNSSAERLCLPELNEDDFVEAVVTLVNLDRDWVPQDEGTSLYVRPFMIGDDHSLGVHGVHHAIFMVILSPVASYYKEGLNPVSIMIVRDDVRVVFTNIKVEEDIVVPAPITGINKVAYILTGFLMALSVFLITLYVKKKKAIKES